ncbi:icarapin-like isoform X1 [Schistocerca gregaria]|uniref:icarapin-like isoform X1 n=1 Tax=Schistocerca gregaria TaxID=7010 RepID=UPI00211DCEAD|nr:icarapin-like isoform X1 [Schistocerca gregaria]
MKAIALALVFVFAVIAATNAFPRTSSDTELVFVPLESRAGVTESVEDVDDSSDDDDDFIFPFGGFFGFSSFMQDFMRRITDVLKGLPDGAFNFGKEGNTTSTTKVVGGHVITVNETVYKNDDDTGVYKIQVIEVKPTEGAIDSEQNPTETSDSASPEQVSENDNEIPKGKTEDVAERFDRSYSENTELLESPEYYSSVFYDNLDNTIDAGRYVDLSRDTYVNAVLSDQAVKGGMVMIDPDAELIDVNTGEVIDFSGLQNTINEKFK